MRLPVRVPRLRLPRRLVFWALAGASLLVAHDAVFLVQLGPGEPLARALRDGGHGYWETASMLLLAAGVVAALAVGIRLAMLRRRARSLAAGRLPIGPRPSRGRIALGLWARLLPIVAIGFTVQENLEHLAGHEHVLGLAALHGPAYPLALPVLAAVTAVAALVGAVLIGVERELLATIAASLARRHGRAPRIAVRPPVNVVTPRRSPLARSQAGRAPPLVLVTVSST
jgi:hypothetical protein